MMNRLHEPFERPAEHERVQLLDSAMTAWKAVVAARTPVRAAVLAAEAWEIEARAATRTARQACKQASASCLERAVRQ